MTNSLKLITNQNTVVKKVNLTEEEIIAIDEICDIISNDEELSLIHI